MFKQVLIDLDTLLNQYLVKGLDPAQLWRGKRASVGRAKWALAWMSRRPVEEQVNDEINNAAQLLSQRIGDRAGFFVERALFEAG